VFPKARPLCGRRWKSAPNPKTLRHRHARILRSCRLCLVEIEGRAGTPASCTTPVAPGMIVYTQTEAAEGAPQRRDGALYLRSSARLPHLPPNGQFANCRRRRAMSGCAMCATVMTAPTTSPKKRTNPTLFQLRSGEMHRLQPLRTRLRGSARHLRPDDRRARLREPGFGGAGGAFPRIGMRLLRRLRPGLPDRHPHREIGDRDRPTRTFGGHDLRLLRCRMQLQGRKCVARKSWRRFPIRMARRTTAIPRQRAVRLWLRHPPGPDPETNDSRQGQRTLA